MNKINMFGFIVIIATVSGCHAGRQDQASFPSGSQGQSSAKVQEAKPNSCTNRGGECIVEGGKGIGSGTVDLASRGYQWVTSDENKARYNKAWNWTKEQGEKGYNYVEEKVSE